LNKLGVIIIATGKYISFVDELVKSVQEFIGFKGEITFFLFTDKENMSQDLKFNVKKIEYNYTKWPMPTLMRYKGILGAKSILQDQNYLLYLDVDMKINSSCADLFESEIFAVRHPRHKISQKLPFEKNYLSSAYIGQSSYRMYVCGGIQGGKSKRFLEAVEDTSKKIESDLKQNYIAKWHDESYWNKYVSQNNDIQIFSSSYCWPQQWVSRRTPGKVIALKKDHSSLRNNSSLLLKIRFILSDLRMKILQPNSY
jgi:histo-blood group ABO system transferase